MDIESTKLLTLPGYIITWKKGDNMRNYYITGYSHFNLGIFNEQDERLKIIKNFLRKIEIELLEDGIDWFLFSGQLGIEYDAFNEALQLKEEYPDLKLGVLFPFERFGENWNEKNQLRLSDYHQRADFVDYVSKRPYETPAQLKKHTQFLLSHTEGSVLLYDEEYPSRTRYFLKDAQQYSEHHPYQIQQYRLEDIQNFVYDIN